MRLKRSLAQAYGCREERRFATEGRKLTTEAGLLLQLASAMMRSVEAPPVDAHICHQPSEVESKK